MQSCGVRVDFVDHLYRFVLPDDGIGRHFELPQGLTNQIQCFDKIFLMKNIDVEIRARLPTSTASNRPEFAFGKRFLELVCA